MLTEREERWVKEQVEKIDTAISHEAEVEAHRLRVVALKAKLREDERYTVEDYDRDLKADPVPVKSDGAQDEVAMEALP